MRGQMDRNRTGQATLEYLLILAVVISAIVIASVGFKTKVTETLTSAENAVAGAGGKLSAGLQ